MGPDDRKGYEHRAASQQDVAESLPTVCSEARSFDSLNGQRRNAMAFMTTNVNGLCSNTKQSELSIMLKTHHIDAAVITETHLSDNIDDRRIMQPGYSFLRRDRNFSAVYKSKGGGVVIYLQDEMTYIQPNIQVPPELEVSWCILKPSHPDSVILAGVYVPPDASADYRQMLLDHLVTTVDLLRSARPRARTLLMGDFNRTFNAESLSMQLAIRQIITVPTRGLAVLDKVFTDFVISSPPVILSPVSTADHNTIIWSTSGVKKNQVRTKTVRPLTDSSVREFGRWICAQDWQDVMNSEDIDTTAEILHAKLTDAYEKCFPEITYQCRLNEPSWLTQRIKNLITMRNRAHSRQQWNKLKLLRQKVDQEIRKAKERWYKRRMENLDDSKRSWYSHVRALTHRHPPQWSIGSTNPGAVVHMAEVIDDFFAQICTTFDQLSTKGLPPFLPADEIPFEIQPWQVAKKLSQLRQGMAVPNEDLPMRLMKEFSIELAVPLSHIFNKSLREGKIPLIWKQATVIPVPKKPAPESPEDLRPVSLTPTFCKLLEQFIVPLMVADIKSQIDIRQYGNVKRASANHYLIRLIHNMLTELDKPDKLFQ